jgi:LysM repeat protein
VSTPRLRRSIPVGLVLAALVASAPPRTARAQTSREPRVYVVEPGDTLSSIADELGVSPRELAARNGLQAPFRLRVGRRLRLPPGVDPDVARDLPTRARLAADEDGASRGGPGLVTLARQRDGATLTTNLHAETHGHRMRLERFLRFRDGSRHAIHPRLIRAVATLGEHFAGRRVVVLSGFRPQLRNPSAPRTRHSQGYAVDLRVEGVPVRAVHAFCTTLDALGCGLYPRGGYVHIDVRREAASWTENGGTDAHAAHSRESDETVAEVLADAAPVRGANDRR